MILRDCPRCGRVNVQGNVYLEKGDKIFKAAEIGGAALLGACIAGPVGLLAGLAAGKKGMDALVKKEIAMVEYNTSSIVPILIAIMNGKLGYTNNFNSKNIMNMDIFGYDIDFDGDGIFECGDNDIANIEMLTNPDIYHPSFTGSDFDGFIPDGKITLERTISGIDDSFEVFRKNGHLWVETSPNHYVQVDGSGTVKINGIEYDKA